jgi:hypothetical protein
MPNRWRWRWFRAISPTSLPRPHGVARDRRLALYALRRRAETDATSPAFAIVAMLHGVRLAVPTAVVPSPRPHGSWSYGRTALFGDQRFPAVIADHAAGPGTRSGAGHPSPRTRRAEPRVGFDDVTLVSSMWGDGPDRISTSAPAASDPHVRPSDNCFGSAVCRTSGERRLLRHRSTP